MKKILVAVDGSDGANRAARYAARLASETGASITLLHVYDAPTAALLGLEALSPAQVEQTREKVSKGSFDAALRAIGETKVHVSTHTALGHPAREVVSYAKEDAFDLIVMGSRGLSDLRGYLLGGVSQYVVRNAGCPVLIMPSS